MSVVESGRSVLELRPAAPRFRFEVAGSAAPNLRSLAERGQRARIWELAGHLHCSIIGTCLSTSELRSLLTKLGLAKASASDHELHGQAVSLAGRHDQAAKLLQKALDQRHRIAIHQFDKAKSEAELRLLWDGARQRGEIPGGYWAALTHPAASNELIRQIFGEVHMLSHLVGAANRADIRRLSDLEAENALLREKVQRQEAQLRDAVVSRDARIGELNQLLARKLEEEPIVPGEAGVAELVAELRRRLEAESGRRAALEQRLERTAAEHRAEQGGRVAAEAGAAALRRELEAMERRQPGAAGDEDADAPVRLSGRVLLYVGGRPKQVWQARSAIAELGADFLHHDGGIEDSGGLLAGLVSRADVVAFPVDCISHDAALMVKRLCRQEGKPLLPLRSSGVGSLLAALDGPEIAALMTPSPAL